MNKVYWISLVALVLLVIALPVYAMQETHRMANAEVELREQYMVEGMNVYIQNCASCHGVDGAGVGMLPPLNNPALAEAQSDMLFDTIARATHGTAMAAWHVDEGGNLNDYQLKEVVTLIQHGDWEEVSNVAYKQGFQIPVTGEPQSETAYLELEGMDDPHQCFACHEEPSIHAGSFGINCARCHNTITWKPAVLTKHEFLLDHGGEGDVDCKTCHVDSYVTYDCYACHDNHQAAEMETAHLAEGISDYAACATCHPTGVEGEAGRLRDEGLSPKGQASLWETSKLLNLAMELETDKEGK